MKLPGRPTLYRLQAPFELEFIARNTSYRSRAKSIDLLVEYFGKDKEAGDITRDMVKHYKAWLADKKNLSEGSIRTHCSAASAFYTWMIIMEVENVTYNPFLSLIPSRGYHKDDPIYQMVFGK